MYRVRRIGVISAANLAAAVILAIGLLLAVFMVVGAIFTPSIRPLLGYLILGLVVYGAFGWISGALGALVYNFVARFTGGLQLTLEQQLPAPQPWTPATLPPSETSRKVRDRSEGP